MNIGFNYDNELIKEGNTQGVYRTNIKWAKNDLLAPTRLQEYFKEQLWMMKGKSALNGGGGDFKVVATYPLSMSVPEVQAFKNAWKSAAHWLNIDEANIKFEIESVAPYYSFLASLKFGQRIYCTSIRNQVAKTHPQYSLLYLLPTTFGEMA